MAEIVKYKHCLDFVIQLNNAIGGIHSVEKAPKKATNSEIMRWFRQHAVHVNGVAVTAQTPVPDVWKSLVLFPKSRKRRITLW